MKILVTGAAGFIGSNLCKKLLECGHTVTGLDNYHEFYSREVKENNINELKEFDSFRFWKYDIENVDTMPCDFDFDVVVNLAAMAGVRNSLKYPKDYAKTNIIGTIALLERCVAENVKRYVYASSSSVYGLNETPFTETNPTKSQNSPYAVSKSCSEIYADYYSRAQGIKTVGLRFFTVFGRKGRPDMAIYKFLKAIHNGDPIDKYGSGETSRDYTYVDDIVEGIYGSIFNEAPEPIYNLGNDQTTTLNELIEYCENAVGKKAIINQMPDQKGDVPYTMANIDLAKRDLNYNPKNSDIQESIKTTYNWMRVYAL